MTITATRWAAWLTRWAPTLLCAAWLATASPAVLGADPAPPALRPAAAGNVYKAGSAVHTDAPVTGDFFAAAGHVTVDQAVAKDVVVAGGEVQVLAAVGEDLRAAGGQITVDAPVAGDVLLAGGRVTITRQTRVGGQSWLAGGDVNVDGTLEHGAKLYAGRVRVNGIVEGDLRVVARSLTLGPQADIRGELRYSSEDAATIDPKAKVASSVREVEPEAEVAAEPPVRREHRAQPLGQVLWWLGLLAAGALWLLLFPSTSAAVVERLSAAPGRSLGLGVLALAATPPLVLVLVLTVLGIPLALLLLASWALAVLLGFLSAAAFVGQRAGQLWKGSQTSSPTARLGAFALALLALALIGQLPFLGALVQMIAVLAGAGALLLLLIDLARGKRAPAPGPQPTQGVST